jgi:hypothetical protein
MPKKKTESTGRTFLVLGCLDRTSAATTVANKIGEKRVTQGDVVYIHATEPFKNAQGEDIEPQFGEYMLGDRKEVENTYMATHPDGTFLFNNGAIVPVAPTVAHLKAVEASQKPGHAAAKKRAAQAKQVIADNAEREANLKAKRGKK